MARGRPRKTSPEVAAIAAEAIVNPSEATDDEVQSLAASALAQVEPEKILSHDAGGNAVELTKENPVAACPEADEPPPQPEPHDIYKTLEPYTKRGVQLKVNGDIFHISYKDRQDSGNLNQPLVNIARCAERLLA